MIDHPPLQPEQAQSDLLPHLEMRLRLQTPGPIDRDSGERGPDRVHNRGHGENVQLLQELIALYYTITTAIQGRRNPTILLSEPESEHHKEDETAPSKHMPHLSSVT